MYGDTNPGANLDPRDGLYGAGRFGYSINQFSSSQAVSAATASWSDLDYDATLSASVSDGEFTKITLLAASASALNLDTKGVRAMFVISGSATDYFFQPSIDALRPQYSNTDACLLYTSPSPRDRTRSRMPSSA